MTRSSTSQHTHTGVCVIRVEIQDGRLLITVTSNPDIETMSLTRLSRHAKDVPSTLGLVANFFDQVAALRLARQDRDGDQESI
jgi:hypothetical protein